MPNIIRSRNVQSVDYNRFNNVFEEFSSEPEAVTEPELSADILQETAGGDFPDDNFSVNSPVVPEPVVQQPEFDKEEFMEKIRVKAEELSKELLDKAKAEAKENAEELRKAALDEGHEKGYKEGYNDGYSAGYVEAYEKGLKAVNQDCDRLLCEIQAGLELFREEKKKIEEENLEGMKELCISIAEKVIGMNLETQSDVIKQMIINALDNSKSTQWIKIHISGFDAERFFEIEKELLESVRHISEFVKVEVIDGADPGTCIIEMPDKIIDASVNTQMSNIKNMLEN